jgi:hypothetical protein
MAQLKAAIEGSSRYTILKAAQLAGGKDTLLYVSILPLFLTIAFTILYLNRKKLTESKSYE